MFKKVLIANRGEIAVRIIRACREMGIRTVAVYSEADIDALHVRVADEAICIGSASSRDSYLHLSNIISSAVITGCEAIHPGYGFLAENKGFAELCESCQIKFIGPPPEVIERMGDKAAARAAMISAGVPVVPGTISGINGQREIKELIKKCGLPLIVKASAGGGGRGMRIVRSEAELENALRMAGNEAEAAFGNGEVYAEHYIEEPRHIEIQIIADQYGRIVHLGERDCSIQRRYQKIVEEAPSPVLKQSKRIAMGKAAVKAARAIGYISAGTIEFLLDKDGKFYFMEMNTRIQVEHPVTEQITGIDLVKAQIAVAAGEKLPFSQDDIGIYGHAIECRINAEDPDNGFAPSTGVIESYHQPGGPGIRVDTCVSQGTEIPPYYDSLIGKLIAWGRDRNEALARMERALAEYDIQGIKTTLPFHRRVMRSEAFRSGNYHTGFIEKQMNE
ncbi:MAG: acetyl-CoA carboxylase biotin carboxylase subunit [bacterium]|jgi:acetyl-CoA carboxylase biotin carboxylase subunit|nr:acetyl-CoA carboxylase biotin carboxylase subunit [bacterium]MDD4153320.1 acetyl-CoA carboxylase biotin carboxylase subunit [bacterium]MDD4557980.1 acetyl-CoA carboxylase biotin carboxylase subunit [bacterium]